NALALFGLILNTVGLFDVSHPWGLLAIELMDRWEDKSLETSTRHVVYNFVCPWTVPLRTMVPSSREVFDIGQRAGDFEYASYAAHMYTYMAMLTGAPLDELRDEALQLGAQMRAFGAVNALHIHAPFEKFLQCLTGAKARPWTLDDADFDAQQALDAAVE